MQSLKNNTTNKVLLKKITNKDELVVYEDK